MTCWLELDDDEPFGIGDTSRTAAAVPGPGFARRADRLGGAGPRRGNRRQLLAPEHAPLFAAGTLDALLAAGPIHVAAGARDWSRDG